MRRGVAREMWWPERVRQAARLLDERDRLAKLLSALSPLSQVNFGNVELQVAPPLSAQTLREMLYERLDKVERRLRRIGVEVGT